MGGRGGGRTPESPEPHGGLDLATLRSRPEPLRSWAVADGAVQVPQGRAVFLTCLSTQPGLLRPLGCCGRCCREQGWGGPGRAPAGGSLGGAHGASTSVRFRGSGNRGYAARDVLRIEEDVWVAFPQVTSVGPVPSRLPSPSQAPHHRRVAEPLGHREPRVAPQRTSTAAGGHTPALPCPVGLGPLWGGPALIQQRGTRGSQAVAVRGPFAVRSDVSQPGGGASPGPREGPELCRQELSLRLCTDAGGKLSAEAQGPYPSGPSGRHPTDMPA